jgi:hypothetical protein
MILRGFLTITRSGDLVFCEEMLLAGILAAVLAAQSTPQSPATSSTPASKTAVSTSTPSPWTDDKPITHLFQNLAHDLRELPTPESGIILAAGVGGAVTLESKDASVAAWEQRQPSSSAASFGNAIGNGWTEIGGSITVWAAGKIEHNDEIAHIGSDLIRAQALAGLLTTGFKYAADRTRPNGGSDSMPSGHTSSAFATAAVLQSHYGWGMGTVSYAVASFVGWSRIRSNNHWLTDVVMGSAIGTMSGRTVARTHKSTWTVTPVKTPGGAAIMVARLSAGSQR